jgi:transcriptional regulator with XRE-family HTH domain
MPVPVNPHDVWVGQRLKAARLEAKLTLRGLAKRLGWQPATLSRIERGERPARVSQLIAIAEVVGRSPAALLVEQREAAVIVDRVAVEPETVLQVAYFLTTLEDELPPPPAGFISSEG